MKGKKVLLGVTGGIAAYKAITLCSRLVQAGAEVRVIMTESATKLVSPVTFQALSKHAVATDTFEEKDASVVMHINWADWADLVVVAPATANIIGKFANGIADDMLSTTLLAVTAPVLFAPAMNVHMYENAAVQRNLQYLIERGVLFVDPEEGQLACGYVGKGRMAEPETIFAKIQCLFTPDRTLEGKKVLITAGGTRERLDPVRYISNDSSGKMGYALAQAAQEMGAAVTLVSANVTALAAAPDVEVVPVESAQQMYDAVMSRFDQVDIVVKAAAVSDYRPVTIAEQKMKKTENSLTIHLERTPDILAELGAKKRSNQFVIGFAAETEQLEKHASEKLQRKRCDLLIANDVTQQGAGFGSDTNSVVIVDAGGVLERIEVRPKLEIANRILRIASAHLAKRKDETSGSEKD